MSLCLVRLIEPVFRSIEHRDSSFLKTVFWLIQTFFQNFFKLFSLSSTWQGSIEVFLSFFTQIFARFFSHKAGKTFIPFLFFFFFMISCIISCILREFSELFKFGVFVESILFFWNWLLGFASILIYSWYMLVNLINLGFCEQVKILGFVLKSDLGILLNWVKIDEIGLLNWCNWSL